MPAFLTHWYVLIETARRMQDAGSELASLIIDKKALQEKLAGGMRPTTAGAVWNTGPQAQISYSYPGSDISALAYLGALAPDITSFQKRHFYDKQSDKSKRMRTSLQAPLDRSVPWHVLLHTNRSGDFILSFLESSAAIASPALRSQALAFAMGYLSHIAADIALNPYINAMASIYRPEEIPGWNTKYGMHYYVEQCLDDYLAKSYFGHKRNSWPAQAWKNYIEPAAQQLNTPGTLTSQLMMLLTKTADKIYGLSEKQSQIFIHDYQNGLYHLRRYLAGNGETGLSVLLAHIRKRQPDPIETLLGARPQGTGEISSEDALNYAIQLSEHFCQHAINYYKTLRSPQTLPDEQRLESSSAFKHALRNWDLNTGYSIEASFDQAITLRLVHNWVQFADLWQNKQ